MGFELKESYHRQAVRNIERKAAETTERGSAPADLFALAEVAV